MLNVLPGKNVTTLDKHSETDFEGQSVGELKANDQNMRDESDSSISTTQIGFGLIKFIYDVNEKST